MNKSPVKIIVDGIFFFLEDELKNKAYNIDYYKRQKISAEQRIKDCEKNIFDTNIQIEKVKNILKKKNNTKTEIEKALKLPEVESIEVYKHYLVIITKPIFFKNKVLAGQFKIVLNFSNQSIRFFNLSYRVNDFHHPHVNASGTPCMGNLAGTIIQCMLEYKISALITICINYLKSYNNTRDYSPYVWMQNWKNVKLWRKFSGDIKTAYNDQL